MIGSWLGGTYRELTKSWKATFFPARTCFMSCSALTTPSGGMVREYTEVPQVKKATEVYLSTQKAKSCHLAELQGGLLSDTVEDFAQQLSTKEAIKRRE